MGLWSVGGVVRFEPDWTPVFLPRARLRWLKGTVRGPLEQRLQYMLRPVFEQVGAEWESPPISLQSPAGLLGGLALLWALYEGGRGDRPSSRCGLNDAHRSIASG